MPDDNQNHEADAREPDLTGDTPQPTVALEPDEILLASYELARVALLEITPESTVGDVVGHKVDGERLLSMHFATTMPGYPGWHWSVSMARVDDETAPTVLEIELLPGEGALVAPDWLPWSVRLAQFRDSQALLENEERIALEAAAAFGDEDDEDSDDEDDILDNDFSDFDDEIDGVDVDSIDDDVDIDDIELDDDDDDSDFEESGEFDETDGFGETDDFVDFEDTDGRP